jgi:hypothetical protein
MPGGECRSLLDLIVGFSEAFFYVERALPSIAHREIAKPRQDDVSVEPHDDALWAGADTRSVSSVKPARLRSAAIRSCSRRPQSEAPLAGNAAAVSL